MATSLLPSKNRLIFSAPLISGPNSPLSRMRHDDYSHNFHQVSEASHRWQVLINKWYERDTVLKRESPLIRLEGGGGVVFLEKEAKKKFPTAIEKARKRKSLDFFF
ncbi:hypothetical protein TNCV_2568791 [Trichonephila clavipes]|uniref:Uncharacterized protein n=1 Tax=Trichonephila clavipes TaxID=2585209 RepID=A0A8X7BNL8_TRICX|nr:hypothetical protein TNCV_2568791 [Trichonephila clavipes]